MNKIRYPIGINTDLNFWTQLIPEKTELKYINFKGSLKISENTDVMFIYGPNKLIKNNQILVSFNIKKSNIYDFHIKYEYDSLLINLGRYKKFVKLSDIENIEIKKINENLIPSEIIDQINHIFEFLEFLRNHQDNNKLLKNKMKKGKIEEYKYLKKELIKIGKQKDEIIFFDDKKNIMMFLKKIENIIKKNSEIYSLYQSYSNFCLEEYSSNL